VMDPFMLLWNILETSALTWARFLDFQLQLQESLRGDAEETANSLRRDKEVVDRGQTYFAEMIGMIDDRFLLHWPTSSEEKHIRRVHDEAVRMRATFVSLATTAAQQSQLISALISIEMNTISILDSKKSLKQSRNVMILTWLAFAFIPLSFMSSVFGMNVKELTSGNAPPLRYFFAVAIPLTVLCLLVPAWSIAYRESGSWAIWKKRPVDAKSKSRYAKRKTLK